jgi:hypothetical protein
MIGWAWGLPIIAATEELGMTTAEQGTNSEPNESIAVRVEETVVTERVGDEIVILEEVDIEEFVTTDRSVPDGRRYRFRVNKTKCVSEKPELTGAEILEAAKLVPVKDYILRMKRRQGPPEEVKLDQTVHLQKHGVERFIAQKREVQDGLEARRQFTLSPEDTQFLDSLGLRWEAVLEGKDPWVIIYDLPLPAGYAAKSTNVAIQIAAGYPTAQLDMAYFYPPIVRADRRPIIRTEGTQTLDGKTWQRWSRHRLDGNKWVPGVDNLETHFAYMQSWLTREVQQ